MRAGITEPTAFLHVCWVLPAPPKELPPYILEALEVDNEMFAQQRLTGRK